MDPNQILEYIVPIIFLIIWSVAKVLGAKTDQAEEYLSDEESQVEAPDPFQELFGPVILPEPEKVEQKEGVGRKSIPFSEEEERAYEKSQEAIRAVEASKKKRERAHVSLMKGDDDWGRSKHRRSSTGRESVSALLKTPQAARKAVLLHEILGTPVGVRQDGKMSKSWDIA